ncbi:MAG TPA: hypothetical protein VLT62_23735 [Candidatus Methylomirabilis sp.]|nr:hypothetical protein [Candidatus Methylomirabilis sp.]
MVAATSVTPTLIRFGSVALADPPLNALFFGADLPLVLRAGLLLSLAVSVT